MSYTYVHVLRPNGVDRGVTSHTSNKNKQYYKITNSNKIFVAIIRLARLLLNHRHYSRNGNSVIFGLAKNDRWTIFFKCLQVIVKTCNDYRNKLLVQ